MSLSVGTVSYGSALIAYAIFAALAITSWRKRLEGSALYVPIVGSIVWSAIITTNDATSGLLPFRVFIAESVHDLGWMFFLASVFGNSGVTRERWLVTYGGLIAAIAVLVTGLGVVYVGRTAESASQLGQVLILGSITVSLFGLVTLEQLFRNLRPTQRNDLKFLCLGIAGILAFDLILYSSAVIEGAIVASIWNARGFVETFCLILIAVSVVRTASWQKGVFASRRLVVYSTTLIATGVYLLLIGTVGTYVRSIGAGWGIALQIVLVVVAALTFFAMLLSRRFRNRGRVFVLKHFFSRKYDFRSEWLRLNRNLTSNEFELPTKKRAIKAIADILVSPSGYLWLRSYSSDVYQNVAGWNVAPNSLDLASQHRLPQFLEKTAWIVNVSQLARDPGAYDALAAADLPAEIATEAYVVPLLHESELIGFVALAESAGGTIELNFEDHDLLRTAGQQVASFLAQELSAQRLSESRQFEAYNQFTAFVMHDLKNAIAQQSLVVENAAKHKRNPDFIDDAIDAIKGSVGRLQKVLGHLQQSVRNQPLEHVDISKVLAQVESQCSDREPVPIAELPGKSIFVQASPERLAAAIVHAVRNAQDACEHGGEVRLFATEDPRSCLVVVSDNGTGMTKEFIREHLFRPFDSTKGSEGMGIGAYQIRETLRSIGGEVLVESDPDGGTKFTMVVPLSK